jgi:hypothetical protein
MSNLLQYVKKCKDCLAEILMKNIAAIWSALEKDGITQHRCRKPIVAIATATKIIQAEKPSQRPTMEDKPISEEVMYRMIELLRPLVTVDVMVLVHEIDPNNSYVMNLKPAELEEEESGFVF